MESKQVLALPLEDFNTAFWVISNDFLFSKDPKTFLLMKVF